MWVAWGHCPYSRHGGCGPCFPLLSAQHYQTDDLKAMLSIDKIIDSFPIDYQKGYLILALVAR